VIFFSFGDETYLREGERLARKEESETRKMGEMGLGRIRERFV